jgi:CRISPR-associated protein Csh1
MYSKFLELDSLFTTDRKQPVFAKLNEWIPDERQRGFAVCFSPGGVYAGVKPYSRREGVFYISASSPNGFSRCGLQYITNRKNPAKTVKKIQKALDCISHELAPSEPLKNTLVDAYRDFDEDRVSSDLARSMEGLSKDDRPYVFLAVLDDGGITPLYSLEVIKWVAYDELLRRYSGNGEMKAEGRTCSVCGTTGKTVYGNFSLLKCYNLDKPGMITGGFSPSQTPANFPVCSDCIIRVTNGYNFARERLSFTLCGQRYLVLPKVQDPEIRDLVVEVIGKVHEKKTLTGNRLRYITAQEDELLKELADAAGDKDSITLSLIFYESKQADWRIRAEINEVLPSRIHLLYDVKKELESDLRLRLSKREQQEGYYFTLATLRPFAGDDGVQSDRLFLSWVEAIFRRGQMNQRPFLARLVRRILAIMKQDPDNWHFCVRDAWSCFLFMIKTQVLRVSANHIEKREHHGGIMKGRDEGGKYGQFIRAHPEFFDRPEKTAAFLTGCYVSTVLYVQHKNLGNDPFFRKVRGLKLDEKRLRDLYPEARNKLHQYGELGMVTGELDPLLASTWVQVGNQWAINDDETTFAFTLGLALGRNIASEIKVQQEVQP